MEDDRGRIFILVFSQHFLKVKKLHDGSRFTNKGASVGERVIRTIREKLKKSSVTSMEC